MTRKEFWLKLFAENDTALAAVLILVDRFATEEQLQRGKEYIESRKKELYEEMPLNEIQSVFSDYHPTEKVCTGKRCPMQVGYDVSNCKDKECIYRTETEKGGVE